MNKQISWWLVKLIHQDSQFQICAKVNSNPEIKYQGALIKEKKQTKGMNERIDR